MTGSHPDTRDDQTRPISVAELLARNGTIGSPPAGGRRRRRRGNSDAVTVAELTGEIPIIRDHDQEPGRTGPEPVAEVEPVAAVEPVAEPEPVAAVEPVAGPEPVAAVEPAAGPEPVAAVEPAAEVEPAAGWAEPGPRWPKSMPQPLRAPGPEHSHYPRPVRRSEAGVGSGVDDWRPGPEFGGAEQMSPDPVDGYAAVTVAAPDSDLRDAAPPVEDTTEALPVTRPRKVFGKWRNRGAGAGRIDEAESGPSADAGGPASPEASPGPGSGITAEVAAAITADVTAEPGRVGDLDEDRAEIEAEPAGEAVPERSRWAELYGALLTVAQSLLAVLFGAGLFLAFDHLWRWNSIVALVLTVLVTLGLVAAVQVVRRTVDIGSTLIAVAVGLLITLGPLALHAS